MHRSAHRCRRRRQEFEKADILIFEAKKNEREHRTAALNEHRADQVETQRVDEF